ncbi:hypothetical protein [Actinoplanes sp. G11-F43]|uniref:hypothetical protein n=1 Tax=Actinoplanes sp. G11-F43 TaxID=3424130 RepID=UPI003D34B2A9
MNRTRILRTALATTLASAALTLGMTTPARAADVVWSCTNTSSVHTCYAYTGAAGHYSGRIGVTANGSGWQVVNVPAGGFTTVLRVWPTSGGSIDYPAGSNGRVLSYGISSIQLVVVGHETSNRIFI